MGRVCGVEKGRSARSTFLTRGKLGETALRACGKGRKERLPFPGRRPSPAMARGREKNHERDCAE